MFFVDLFPFFCDFLLQNDKCLCCLLVGVLLPNLLLLLTSFLQLPLLASLLLLVSLLLLLASVRLLASLLQLLPSLLQLLPSLLMLLGYFEY